MAEQTDIDLALSLLPPDAKVGQKVWDETVVSEMLDADKTIAQIMSNYWHSVAASTASYVDISESGSSRSFGNIYRNALELAKYWDDRVKAEADEAKVDEGGRDRIAFRRVKRV